MKQGQAKQIENEALIAQLNKSNELTTADLDAVTGGTGKQPGLRLTAACCTGRHISSANITI